MLKKILVTVSFFMISILLMSCGRQSSSELQEKKTGTYQESVANLEEITLQELNEKIANSEEFLIYLGRPTCGYCQVFVPKLAEAHQEKSARIYYLNSDEADAKDWNEFIAYFGIKTVPHFSYFSDKQMVDSLLKGSESTVDEIKAFIEKYSE
ncbi:thioredoxin domain-containing protein [Streptococcus hillyeri]|uniref:Thiol reductase thioredoxin n=1 Tax=Streptococcus hillyeri TaxID=2282420 RepID=A0A3L9DJH3_9STRE|nr:thioredoxin domain-containing protein [Streptococcus hillyeri]RLY01125.1 thiol reductase thioredoxin [Streptococcus hillyeri]